MKRLKQFLFGINLLLCVATLLALFTPFVNPETTYIFAFIGLAFVWMVFFHLAFIFFWLITDRRYSWASILTVLFSFVGITDNFGFGIGDKDFPKNSVSILSYNIRNASAVYDENENTANKKRGDFQKFLLKFKDIDILCIQESSTRARGLIETALAFKYKYQHPDRQLTIYSRYPVLDSGQVSFESKSNGCIWADLNLGFDTIRVYNVHLQSNMISKDAQIISDNPKFAEAETWLGVKKILGKYRTFASIRAEQVSQIIEHQKSTSLKIIVAGDFNDPPQSFTYHTMTKNLNDSFLKKGFGIGGTYSGPLPTMRIDYILADRDSDICNFHVFKDDYSDHFPIMTTIAFPK